MTIGEEIKETLFRETESSIKSFIKEIIINNMKTYKDRLVGFCIHTFKMASPCVVCKSDAPFPQVIINIYIPEIMESVELNKWLKGEGFEWDMVGGVNAWRLK